MERIVLDDFELRNQLMDAIKTLYRIKEIENVQVEELAKAIAEFNQQETQMNKKQLKELQLLCRRTCWPRSN